MFSLFKEKCLVCKMELKKEETYPEEVGRKFCSENCKTEYKKMLTGRQSNHSGHGCCH